MDDSKRPNLDDLREPTPTNMAWVRQRLQDIRSMPEFESSYRTKTLVKEIKAAGFDVTENSFNHFMNGRSSLRPDAYAFLIQRLISAGLCSNLRLKTPESTTPDALFHEICRFLEVGYYTMEKVNEELPGLYRVWRASVHVPGSFIHGMMEINLNAETGALKTRETHVFKGERLAAAQREVFEGYVVKKSHYYLMLSRQTDRYAGPPRITMIHNVMRGGDRIQGIEAVTTACYGSNRLFSAPVYMERVPEDGRDQLEADLDITPSIPPSVRAKLRFRVEDHVIYF